MRAKLLKYFVFLIAFSLPSATHARLVTTSPQLTEIVFQLGKYADVVAGSPVPGTSLTPTAVGTWFLPSLERVIAVDADWLLLDSQAVPRYLADRFSRHARQVFSFQLLEPKELFAQTKAFLQKAYNEPPPALWHQSLNCLIAFQSRQPFTYLAVVWMSPLTVFGRRTFLSQLLENLGGKNLAPPTPWNAYPALTEEWLTRNIPERVFIFSDIPHAREVMEAKARKLWPGKPVEIIPIDTNHFARASFTVFRHLSELKLPTGLPHECQY